MSTPPRLEIEWTQRLARENGIPALEALIPVSVRALHAVYYSPAQIKAALGPIFGVDRQLIRDETRCDSTTPVGRRPGGQSDRD